MAGMKGLKKRRRVQVILLAALSLAAGVAAIYFFVPQQAFNYFRTPSQVVSDPPRPGEVFRIGGLVSDGSIVRGDGETIRFTVTDTNETIPVEYTGILPDLFAEGQGMVGTGSMQGEVFVATEILAKHDETYMPAEVVDALKEQGVYKDPEADPGS
jgi:cytochrome c-type biogenesis protein CcmE